MWLEEVVFCSIPKEVETILTFSVLLLGKVLEKFNQQIGSLDYAIAAQ